VYRIRNFLHRKFQEAEYKPNTVGYAITNVTGSRTSFVLAYIEIYVFRGNPLQAHSIEKITIQHNSLNRKNTIQNKNISVNII